MKKNFNIFFFGLLNKNKMSYVQQTNSPHKLDFYNYFIKSLTGGGIMLIYDKFMENNSLNLCL